MHRLPASSCILLLCGIGNVLFAQELKVEFSSTERGESVYVQVFNQADEFVSERIIPFKNEIAEMVITDLEPGIYRFQAFHDLNGNGELDTYWYKLPKEPYAFSNNARGSMGPPSKEDQEFELNEDVFQKIKLQ